MRHEEHMEKLRFSMATTTRCFRCGKPAARSSTRETWTYRPSTRPRRRLGRGILRDLGAGSRATTRSIATAKTQTCPRIPMSTPCRRNWIPRPRSTMRSSRWPVSQIERESQGGCPSSERRRHQGNLAQGVLSLEIHLEGAEPIDPDLQRSKRSIWPEFARSASSGRVRMSSHMECRFSFRAHPIPVRG